MAITKENASLLVRKSHLARERNKLEQRLAVIEAMAPSHKQAKTKALTLTQPEPVINSVERESKALAEVKVNQLLKDDKSDIVDAQKLKILVETADKLYGWSRSEGPSTMVQVNYLSELKPEDVPQPVVVGAVQAKPDSVSG